MKITFLKSLTAKSIALVLLIFGVHFQASADTIAFIGTGNVSQALAIPFGAAGHDIVLGHRDPQRADNQELAARIGGGTTVVLPAEAVIGADIVVVAVPGGAFTSVIAGLGDLSGKIIIDPTNPLYPDPEDGLANPLFPISNAEMAQNMLPDSFVVKAFNTLGVGTMNDPESAGGPVTIPYAGNDDDAKAVVHELIELLGLNALDVGKVRHAYVLEGMLALWANGIGLGMESGTMFDYHLQVHPNNQQMP